MTPLDVEADYELPDKDGRLGSRDTHVSGAKEEMTSCGRRSAGPGRQLILVAWSFKDARRPLDMKAGHARPRKDRRLGPCDTHVSGMKEEAEMSTAQCRSRTVTQIDRMVPYRLK